jgi:hypothetical protein
MQPFSLKTMQQQPALGTPCSEYTWKTSSTSYAVLWSVVTACNAVCNSMSATATLLRCSKRWAPVQCHSCTKAAAGCSRLWPTQMQSLCLPNHEF